MQRDDLVAAPARGANHTLPQGQLKALKSAFPVCVAPFRYVELRRSRHANGRRYVDAGVNDTGPGAAAKRASGGCLTSYKGIGAWPLLDLAPVQRLCAATSGSGHSLKPCARLIAKFRTLGQSALA
jgi:hypothetical protein